MIGSLHQAYVHRASRKPRFLFADICSLWYCRG